MRSIRTLVVLGAAAAALAPVPAAAQAHDPGAAPLHVAVEATTLSLDSERARRVGLGAVVISAGDARLADGGRGNVRVGARVGSLDVAAWLTLLRDERAVRRESTQRLLVLSGSPAELSSGVTVIGAFGQEANGGPAMWVEPAVLEDGRVRLRLWTATAEAGHAGWGAVWQEVPVEARTEVVVPDGTPVLVAATARSEERSRSGPLGRGTTSSDHEAWIVVTARVVEDPSAAFTPPAGPLRRER